MIFLFLALVAMLFSQAELPINFDINQHEVYFRDFILILDHRFCSRLHLKIFLSRALEALFFSRAKPLEQFW